MKRLLLWVFVLLVISIAAYVLYTGIPALQEQTAALFYGVTPQTETLVTNTQSAPAPVISTAELWDNTVKPSETGSGKPVELGVRIRTDVPGNIRQIQFYKIPGDTGTHVGHLWTTTGALLGSVTFINETASGWQSANFSTPIAIAANTPYIASYSTSNGFYAVNSNYFSTVHKNGVIRALASNTKNGPNGVYVYNINTFPTSTWNNRNYWVDVVFDYQSSTTTPPSACTYTYSAWGTCASNSTQTRTVASSTPTGCTGTPVTSQSCTYVPPVQACTYTYGAWSDCQSNNTQTRTYTSAPAGCTGTPVTSQSCTYAPPVVPPPVVPPPTSTGAVTWTTFTAAANTQKIYVSSSGGNDSNTGLDSAHPVKTLAKGYSLIRDGYPDWLLLKAGDTWTNESFSWRKSGLATAQMLISSYGTGAQPIISETADNNGINFYGLNTSNVAMVGLHLVGQGNGTGIFIYGSGNNFLVENCTIEGFIDNFVAEPDTSLNASKGPSHVTIRGSRILDAYNAGGPKSQGIFASTADGMLIEFNVIDHNGWKTGFQVPDDRSHNMYLDDMTNLTIRNNIISNASSEGILVRSENGANLTNHVLIENNLLAANGNSMSVGAKTGEGASVQYGAIDATIRNNVLTETGRVLGGADQSYGIDLGSINGGLITNNLLLNKPNNGTSFGIRLESIVASQNVTISNNVLYNWNQGFVGLSAGPLTNIQVIGNKFQDKLYQSPSVSSEGVLSTARATFSNNTYYTNAAASNWFMIQDAPKSFTNWLTLSKETGAVSQAVTFPDVSRTVESYSASIGGSATLSSLIGAERLQSQATWRPELEARNIVNYLGAGFGISPL